MLPTILEPLHLLLRWAHVVAAIMWIGDSFLFMFLDGHLEPPRTPRSGEVQGELWLAHGGGFYEVVKRKYLQPHELPPTLHWFKWESYSTWVSGLFLFCVVYYLGDQAMLVEPGSPLSHGQAIALSVALLFVGVVVYDLLCRTPLVKMPKAFGLLGLVLIVGLAFGLTRLFTPRAVFLQVGAMIATIMSSNVRLRIIPAQKNLVASSQAGTKPELWLGARAKQRSTHNHYLTFPVILMMLSNHFPSVYGSRWPYLALGLLVVLGVGIKTLMNRRLAMPKVQLAGTFGALAGVIYLSLPSTAGARIDFSGAPKVAVGTVEDIVEARCVTCHSAHPSNPAFPAPPMGVMLDSPENLRAHKDRIMVRAVQTRTMPLGNLTGMTDQERQQLGAWIFQGADLSGAHKMGEGVGPAVAQGGPPKDPAMIFKQRCAMCHGQTGQGDGPAAATLQTKPRNFTDPTWQKSVTDDHLQKVILGGGPSVGKSDVMPANPDLEGSPETVQGLVKLVRSLAH